MVASKLRILRSFLTLAASVCLSGSAEAFSTNLLGSAPTFFGSPISGNRDAKFCLGGSMPPPSLLLLRGNLQLGGNHHGHKLAKTTARTRKILRAARSTPRRAADASASSSDTPANATASILLDTPSRRQLLAFALPTLAMRITSPLMSLIDSAVVGTYGTVSQVAALSPGSITCDSTSYLLTFLGIACTNLFATAMAKKEEEEGLSVIRSCLFLAVVTGVALQAAIMLLGPSFLSVFTAGSTGADVTTAAITYASIRAWGMPASIITMVAQAACFGAKDATTPLHTVLLSGGLNLVLCLLFVHLWPALPIAGVACATAIAQWVGCLYIVNALRARFFKTAAMPSGSWRIIQVPAKKQADDISDFAGPAFLALFGKVICYSTMSYAAAGAGTVALAAHQVLMQVFFFFANIGDAVSLTVQSFLPPVLASANRPAVLTLLYNCLFVSLLLGVLDAFAAAAIPLFAWRLFTDSLAVAAQMKTQTLLLAGGLLVHSNVMALEGILFASRESSFLARAYAVSTIIFTAAMFYARRISVPLQVVWGALFAYQVVRILQFSLRVKRDLGEKNFPSTVAQASGSALAV